MGSERAEPLVDGETREVFQWRFDQARSVGLTRVEAHRFALNGCDIEQMRRLAKAGCPRRILADIIT